MKQEPITRYWEKYAERPYNQVSIALGGDEPAGEEPYVAPTLNDLLQRPERTAYDLIDRPAGATAASIETGYTPPSLQDVITGKHRSKLGRE